VKENQRGKSLHHPRCYCPKCSCHTPSTAEIRLLCFC
jgi:hypothetical protein